MLAKVFLLFWFSFCYIRCQVFNFVSRERGVILHFWLCQYDVMDGRQRRDGGRGVCSVISDVALSEQVIRLTPILSKNRK